MAKKVPQDIAFRLAQKAKDADKKIKAAEKKAQQAEKKAAAADKKIKAAEKKAKQAEKKAKEAAEKSEEVSEALDDDFDDIDFDELDDFDDFDDFDDEKGEDTTDDPGSVGESESQPTESEPRSTVENEGDDDLDALMKEASASEESDVKVARANKLTQEGDFAGALEIWKELTANEGNDPANWRGLAAVLESRDADGDAEKARTARGHADRIETQAIAEATGRKMEDIIADLLDDGILNFSAGSDAKDQE
tara:strand:- start:46 stop:798 length:753 start_codon:yes stop_codon:yes gene_type:complete